MNNIFEMFQELKLPIPESVFALSEDKQKEIYDYLKQMDDHHKRAYVIAYHHLGTSFNIWRSNGYKEWKEKKV
jgi:cytochrome c1